METFGRGCLYCLLGVGALLLLSLVTQAHIQVPWFIALPLIAFAFWKAAQKTREKQEAEGEEIWSEDEINPNE